MKKRIALIGCGVISAHYLRGLTQSKSLELCAVSDLDEHCYARTMYGDFPFYTDCLRMAEEQKPDIVYIATPPASHAKVAEEMMMRGIDVLIEKPMCTDIDSVYALYRLGRKTGRTVECVFHWKYADEVVFLRDNISKFGQIERVLTVICDDYAAGGRIRPDRRGLGGAWVDSGINVLSYWQEIFSLGGLPAAINEERTDGESGQVYYTSRTLRSGFATVIVDWSTASREKRSVIDCEAGTLEISHTRQTVSLNGREIFSSPVGDRLSSHYFNCLSEYSPDPAGEKRCIQLHRLLFS